MKIFFYTAVFIVFIGLLYLVPAGDGWVSYTSYDNSGNESSSESVFVKTNIAVVKDSGPVVNESVSK